MIITEYFMTRKDGIVLNRTYSDSGFYIVQNETGIQYEEAVDPAELNREYTETNISINTTEEALLNDL